RRRVRSRPRRRPHGDARPLRDRRVRSVTGRAARAAHAPVVLVAAALALAAPARRARAESCGKPDLVDMVPADGATGVPRNAKLGAHYPASADYLNEEVVLVRPDGGEQILPAKFDATE